MTAKDKHLKFFFPPCKAHKTSNYPKVVVHDYDAFTCAATLLLSGFGLIPIAASYPMQSGSSGFILTFRDENQKPIGGFRTAGKIDPKR